MGSTINMEDMRHLNLFSKITRVQTRFCFSYNNSLVFVVPKPKIPQAVGENNSNLRRISEVLKKKIKIVPKPRSIRDAKYFVQLLISPVTCKELRITEKEIILVAGGVQTKAALLGRDKKRFEEMKLIVKALFNREYKII